MNWDFFGKVLDFGECHGLVVQHIGLLHIKTEVPISPLSTIWAYDLITDLIDSVEIDHKGRKMRKKEDWNIKIADHMPGNDHWWASRHEKINTHMGN